MLYTDEKKFVSTDFVLDDGLCSYTAIISYLFYLGYSKNLIGLIICFYEIRLTFLFGVSSLRGWSLLFNTSFIIAIYLFISYGDLTNSFGDGWNVFATLLLI